MQAVYWYVEFELLTEVVMKRPVFRDVRLYGPIKVIGMKAGGKLVFLLGLLFNPVDGGNMFFQNLPDFQQMTWPYIPEDSALYILIFLFLYHCCILP